MKTGSAVRMLALIALGVVAGCTLGEAAEPEMVVYQTPTCGCCSAWAEHAREAGFQVRVEMLNDLSAIRRSMGVPPEVAGCHLGVVDGYVVEGHVPAADVHRLLRERPEVLGLTAPGMPQGSPGMERPDGYREPFAVYTFTTAGAKAVYAAYD